MYAFVTTSKRDTHHARLTVLYSIDLTMSRESVTSVIFNSPFLHNPQDQMPTSALRSLAFSICSFGKRVGSRDATVRLRLPFLELDNVLGSHSTNIVN